MEDLFIGKRTNRCLLLLFVFFEGAVLLGRLEVDRTVGNGRSSAASSE